jgi:hypothetical protein
LDIPLGSLVSEAEPLHSPPLWDKMAPTRVLKKDSVDSALSKV